MTTKTCTKCGCTKQEEEFGWERPGHRHAACKICRAEYQAGYYERNKESELEYKARRQIEKREEVRLYVFTYLAEHPCIECGETNPLVLTFHHVRGEKKSNVSQMVNQGYSLRLIQEEIDKCDVLCANCHMIEEKKRRGTIYPDI